MGLLTTTIGAYPKPEYVELPDWFGNLDTEIPTQGGAEALNKMGDDANQSSKKGLTKPSRTRLMQELTFRQMVRSPEKITFTTTVGTWKE